MPSQPLGTYVTALCIVVMLRAISRSGTPNLQHTVELYSDRKSVKGFLPEF